MATKRSFFALSEVKLGILPAVISPFVIAKIGESNARRYFILVKDLMPLVRRMLAFIHGRGFIG